tara:strand:+ start:72 stop:530 length:459 start_codon:yes stop_codon:yes gene_type:complete
MIKKLLLSILFLIFIYGCSYEPIYSKKNKTDFSIEEISFEGDREINNLINQKLDKYKKKEIGNKLSIFVSSLYTKKSQSKNTSGTTTRYNLETSVKFDIITKNSTSTINITKDFVMKNLSDEFEEKIYEDKIKDNLSESIVNELLIYLPRIK